MVPISGEGVESAEFSFYPKIRQPSFIFTPNPNQTNGFSIFSFQQSGFELYLNKEYQVTHLLTIT